MLNLKFLDPFFKYLDGGKLFRQPFQILYYILGVGTCCAVLYYLSQVFDMVKALNGFAYVYAILMIVVCVAAAAFSLLYWFRRAGEVNKDVAENARFLAIPAVGGLIITFTEWFGLIVAGVGACGGILSAIIFPIAGGGGESFMAGLLGAIGAAVGGYFIIVLGRLFGEQILAIGAIANDTRSIAKNTAK